MSTGLQSGSSISWGNPHFQSIWTHQSPVFLQQASKCGTRQNLLEGLLNHILPPKSHPCPEIPTAWPTSSQVMPLLLGPGPHLEKHRSRTSVSGLLITCVLRASETTFLRMKKRVHPLLEGHLHLLPSLPELIIDGDRYKNNRKRHTGKDWLIRGRHFGTVMLQTTLMIFSAFPKSSSVLRCYRDVIFIIFFWKCY